MSVLIDLSSDTQTRPTPGMRRAMAEAVVGDEQKGEDPTTNQLQDTVAQLTGKEHALFLPSGAMCNQIAFRLWGRPGQTILLHETAHPIQYEAGGAAALSGLQLTPLPGARGKFSAEDLARHLTRTSRHNPKSACVSVEQTTNRGGGAIWTLGEIDAVADVAAANNLPLHMDGARLMNAVVETGISAAHFAARFDSVWVDLTKGLGCPIGAVLAASAEAIEEAFHYKHQFGGAMRQSGIIAAAGLYALDHHVTRLADDHAHARRLGAALQTMPGVKVETDPIETNIVFFSVAGTGLTAPAFCDRLLAESNVRLGPVDDTLVRAVTHLDVTDQDILTAIDALHTFLTQTKNGTAP